MVVTCDHCGARYRFDDERILGRGARITCPRCRHVFVVHKDESVEAAPVDLPPLDIHKLNFASVGIESWKVKVAIGLVYDFSDFKTLRKYIKEGRVTEADHLSHDNENWQEIGALPDLEQHFIDTYRACERARAAVAAAETAALEAALHPTQEEAEAIADALLDAVELEHEPPDVEIEEQDLEVLEPEVEEPPADDRSADEIGNDLLAAMDAAVAAEGDAIDLDMDALLAQNEEEPEAAPPVRRNLETAALAQVQATGNVEAHAHKFVDPFETLKQQRHARSKGRSSRVRGAKRKSKKGDKEQSGTSAGKKYWLVAGLLVVLGYLALESLEPQVKGPDPALAKAAAAKAQTARQAKRGEAYRQKMQAKLKAELKNIQEDDIEAFKVEDEQLIPVGPGEQRAADRLGVGPGVMPGRGARQGPTGEVAQRGTTSEDHVAMGKAAAARGQWPLAATAYGRALQMEPANAELRARRGQALYHAGRHDEAEGELRQAAASGSITAHKVLGHMARDQGDNSGAVAHYQTYLRSGPRDKAAIEKIIQKLTN